MDCLSSPLSILPEQDVQGLVLVAGISALCRWLPGGEYQGSILDQVPGPGKHSVGSEIWCQIPFPNRIFLQTAGWVSPSPFPHSSQSAILPAYASTILTTPSNCERRYAYRIDVHISL